MCEISFLDLKVVGQLHSHLQIMQKSMTNPWILPPSPSNKQPSMIVTNTTINKRYEQELNGMTKLLDQQGIAPFFVKVEMKYPIVIMFS
jgi:hypothetical protein